jgi:hypothetical protein
MLRVNTALLSSEPREPWHSVLPGERRKNKQRMRERESEQRERK